MAKEPNTNRDDAPASSGSGEQQFKLLLGRLASLVGLVIAVFGVLSVFLSQGAAVADISGGAVAVGLGLIGYSLGSRRLGLAVVVLGVLAVFLSLAATQGIVPGAAEGKQNLFEGSPGDPQP